MIKELTCALKCPRFLLLIPILLLSGCKAKNQSEFGKLKNSREWDLQMSDPCTGDWQDKWFLDGEIATVENSENGMNFSAGPTHRDDAHHAVLWTKESFEGDVKIEYNYTRTDTQIVNVNILYIQASGIGEEPYDEDISRWSDLRKVPKMSIYYNFMRTYHISYAAFKMENDDPDADYIRVRKYPVTEELRFRDLAVPPDYYNTGLFLSGVTYNITVIKTHSSLHFQVNGEGAEKLYSWELEDVNPISYGRIGLRHMFTRSANYSDFKVYVK